MSIATYILMDISNFITDVMAVFIIYAYGKTSVGELDIAKTSHKVLHATLLRTIQLGVYSHACQPHKTEAGVPQGSSMLQHFDIECFIVYNNCDIYW